MELKGFGKVAAMLFLAVSPLATQAQDLLADQAPIDLKMKAVDSVALERKSKENFEKDFSANIYGNNWNTSRTFCYSSSSVPSTYKIDLRGFAMPIPNKKYAKVTSKYGYRPKFGRMHKGVDLKVYTGDTIYAAFDGKVRIKKFDANGYGYYIVLRHKNGLETIYAHLSKQLVNINQVVKAGQPIGLGGNTGRSFGSHLHFETRLMGQAINPELIFNFAARDVTGDFYAFNNTANSSYNKKMSTTNNNASTSASTTSTAKHWYKVKAGDTLPNIAKKLGVSVDQLCKQNNIKATTVLKPDRLLKY
jgi:murein DD-endopeptidase MepM/ murein hydrolase activator NlpD